ncbi:MAG: hypothetical protein JWO63_2764 [Frankiales bacterium]|nr:hypothetical protein [Frankiales bacterium]
MNAGLDGARAVADAVLYEGYLLYPYRASSGKNQSRWQFGVLGPVGAGEAGQGEDPSLGSEFLVRAGNRDLATVAVELRFLQLQRRSAQAADSEGRFAEVAELSVGEQSWLSWDEAETREVSLGPWRLSELTDQRRERVEIPAGQEVEPVGPSARLVRSRRALRGELRVQATPVGGELVRLDVQITNTTLASAVEHDAVIAASFIGAHLLVTLEHAEVLSMTDPPEDSAVAAAECRQHRCWPVLAGPEGDSSLMLVSPIILYDHPEIAAQSTGALFDATEIDEILTLRIMTLTEEEKAAARATDPRAAEIIDRCDAMSPAELAQLHGVLRDPRAAGLDSDLGIDMDTGIDIDLFAPSDDAPWWDPAVDGAAAPETDVILIEGVAVAAGSIVRIHPSRRADAQDLFFADQTAKVAAVHTDVEGQRHVAVTLLDDPAADLHEWYGRYLYFAPEEIEPLPTHPVASRQSGHREENRP